MNDPMSGAIPEPRGAAWDSAGAPGRPPVARGVPHSAPVSGSPHEVPGQGMRAPGSRQPGPKASDSAWPQGLRLAELPGTPPPRAPFPGGRSVCFLTLPPLFPQRFPPLSLSQDTPAPVAV